MKYLARHAHPSTHPGSWSLSAGDRLDVSCPTCGGVLPVSIADIDILGSTLRRIQCPSCAFQDTAVLLRWGDGRD